LSVATPNQKETETDNMISRPGFYFHKVALGFGIPSMYGVVEEKLSPDSILYVLKYKEKELVISRLEQGSPVLESNAKALDFLWDRVGRFVRSMMIDHKSFEITFCRQGEKISAVNFVAK